MSKQNDDRGNFAQKTILTPAGIAIVAALLFGASTPAAKLLIGQVQPQLLAGLLYLSSGLGLFGCSMLSRSDRGTKSEARLSKSDWPWLASAVLFGGVIGPLLLMVGLKTVTGEAASLLLNMEAVFTALLAWFAFKENFDRRLLLGMIAIVAGGIFLAWQPGNTVSLSFGGMLVIGACFCWAMDNNLTRKISHADPVQIATVKGLFAGLINASIALFAGTQLPDLSTIVKIIVVGFVGYGLSLVLYIKALRNLGTARTGAYFSTAPFVGAILSFLFLGESINANLAFAAALMAFGVWLHLTEVHEHKHSHVVEEHEHLHRHDEHHQHEHGPDIPPGEPHSHWHRHEAITHAHAHYPDTHHQHHH